MKLLNVTTAVPAEINLLKNPLYIQLKQKFQQAFSINPLMEPTAMPVPVMSETSQFYKKMVELAGNGIRTKATVLYITETGVLLNRDPVVALTVRFYNTKNCMQELHAKTVVSRIAVPKPADSISIAYNAAYPGIIAVL